jgi:hypothetical protein
VLIALKGTKPQERRCSGNEQRVPDATRNALGQETPSSWPERTGFGRLEGREGSALERRKAYERMNLLRLRWRGAARRKTSWPESLATQGWRGSANRYGATSSGDKTLEGSEPHESTAQLLGAGQTVGTSNL